MAPRENPKVLLFLAEGSEDLEAVAILDVCGWTEYCDHIPTVRVTTTGSHNEIRGRYGLVIRPEIAFSEVDPVDYSALALPGGFHSHGFDEAYDERLYDLARTIHAQGGIIATFCVGILPVAEAGLLKGKRATSYPHSRNYDNLRRLRGLGAIVVKNRSLWMTGSSLAGGQPERSRWPCCCSTTSLELREERKCGDS